MAVPNENSEEQEKGSKYEPRRRVARGLQWSMVRLNMIWGNITLEPVMFLFHLCNHLDRATFSQLLIYKSCRVDFDQNSTTCNNLFAPENKELNDEITDKVAEFNVVISFVKSLVPLLIQFYLGALADIFGRKRIMYCYILASLTGSVISLVNYAFITWAKEYTILNLLPVSLVGGFQIWILCVYSFIADISTPDQRAFRMGMISVVENFGSPIGPALGAAIFKAGNRVKEDAGYAAVGISAVAAQVVMAVVFHFSIRRFRWKPNPESQHRRRLLSHFHVIDSIRTFFKRRPGINRKILWVVSCMFLLYLVPKFGEMSIAYLYTYNRFGWQIDQYSTYSSVTLFAKMIGQAILIPLINLLNINEAYILLGVLTSTLVRQIIKGAAAKGWMYYVGAFIDILGTYSDCIMRAMIANCVPMEELGKVYSVIATVECIVPMVFPQVYASIYKHTKNSKVPGAAFFFSCGLIGISYIMAFCVTAMLKGKRLSQVVSPYVTEEDRRQITTNEQLPAVERDQETSNNVHKSPI